MKIIESEAIPVAYTAGRCRFYVKAAGEWNGVPKDTASTMLGKVEEVEEEVKEVLETFGEKLKETIEDASTTLFHTTSQGVESTDTMDAKEVDDELMTAQAILEYRPHIATSPGNTNKLEWNISATDLAWIAEGCYVLGCGGGGSPHHMFLALREAVRRGEGIKVVDLEYFDDAGESDEVEGKGGLVGWGGGMGSPEVSSERLLGEEYSQAMEELLEFMQVCLCSGILFRSHAHMLLRRDLLRMHCTERLMKDLLVFGMYRLTRRG